MIKYHNQYYDPKNLSGYGLNHRGRTKEQYAIDQKNAYKKAIKSLTSKEGLKLKSILNEKNINN